MPSAISPPERYFIKRSTPHVPNSPLPVLIYRSALPTDATPTSVCETIEPNNWLKGGVFKHYGAHHFHSVTHECYAVFRGKSTLLLGRGPLDPADDDDLVVDLKEGDAIVLPAGVAHCSLESSPDYEYVGLYPKVCSSLCQSGQGMQLIKHREVHTGITTSVKPAKTKLRQRLRMRELFQYLIRIQCLV